MTLMPNQRWHMAAYYADDVKPPKQPGELAIQTWAVSESVLQMDVDIANRREDIGAVNVWFGDARRG